MWTRVIGLVVTCAGLLGLLSACQNANGNVTVVKAVLESDDVATDLRLNAPDRTFISANNCRQWVKAGDGSEQLWFSDEQCPANNAVIAKPIAQLKLSAASGSSRQFYLDDPKRPFGQISESAITPGQFYIDALCGYGDGAIALVAVTANNCTEVARDGKYTAITKK